MKSLSIFYRLQLLLALGLIILSGCGGKSGRQDSTGSTTATDGGSTGSTSHTVSLTLEWPSRSRLKASILAERVQINIKRNGTLLSSIVQRRPEGDGGSTVTTQFPQKIQSGPCVLEIAQYSGNNGQSELSSLSMNVEVSSFGELTSQGQSLVNLDLGAPAQDLRIEPSSRTHIGSSVLLSVTCEIQPGIRAVMSDSVTTWRLASSPLGCSLDQAGNFFAADFGTATIQASISSGESTTTTVEIEKPSTVSVTLHRVTTGDFYPQDQTLSVQGDGSGFTHPGNPFALLHSRNTAEGEFEEIDTSSDSVSVHERTSELNGSYRSINLTSNVWGYVRVGTSRKRVQGVLWFNLEDASVRSDGRDRYAYVFTPDSSDPNSVAYAPSGFREVLYPSSTIDFAAG